MNDNLKLRSRVDSHVAVGEVDRPHRIGPARKVRRGFLSRGPGFHFPAPLVKRVGSGLTHIAAASDQNPRHQFRTAGAISISSNGFNWVARTCYNRINSSSARNVTTISTRDAIWAKSSENFSGVPPEIWRRIDSIFSE